ncbi:YlxM family DNA-binding protein [Phosphitispora sp. TUW77]|uniref:YlxM family DNA-binding protein n=1 Tax=Phosphitispora sp. TUW77 TaxID=3152361 RepID=UPI003AB79D3D
MKKIQHIAMLYDFYGKLLTLKQQEILSCYYEHDLSLGEIAEEFGVSRQAVHDILKRGEKLLEGYEEKLGLVNKFISERDKLNQVLSLIEGLEGHDPLKGIIRQIIKEIVEIQQE